MSQNLLIVADSERNADMLYAVRMFVPDPFAYLKIGRRSIIVMSDLELDRARREAPHCTLISQSDWVRKLKKQGVADPELCDVIRAILRKEGLRKITVPSHFPVGLAKNLQRLGIKVKPSEGEIFPERQIKRLEEVKKISAALTMAEVGMAEGIHALKNAKVGRGKKLIYRNNPLTADKLRSIIATAVMQAGGIAANTIVSWGSQTCDPHERGHGVILAGQPIILDVFPRSQKTGYFGDMTRTVVKGRGSDRIRQLYRAVEEAQDLAFSLLRPGVKASTVHEKVAQHFLSLGFKTGRRAGRMEGFFHSTGHGLGLEVHESLRLGVGSGDLLRSGHVVTVEPGLYYPGVGGVRLEDVAWVGLRGAKNLTRFEKVLEV